MLSDAIYRGFEVPLLHELDTYRGLTQEMEEHYIARMTEKTNILHKMKQDQLKAVHKKHQDLGSFKRALVELTLQVDELEKIKNMHYHTAFDAASSTWARVLDCSSTVARAEIEIYEYVARKGLIGGGLEALLIRGVDPFESALDVAADSAFSEADDFTHNTSANDLFLSHNLLSSPRLNNATNSPMKTQDQTTSSVSLPSLAESQYDNLDSVVTDARPNITVMFDAADEAAADIVNDEEVQEDDGNTTIRPDSNSTMKLDATDSDLNPLYTPDSDSSERIARNNLEIDHLEEDVLALQI